MSFVVRMVRMMSLIHHHQSTSVNTATKNVTGMGGGAVFRREGRSNTTMWTTKSLSMIVGGGLLLSYLAENTDLMTLVTHEQSTHVRQSTYQKVELQQISRSLDPRYRSLQE